MQQHALGYGPTLFAHFQRPFALDTRPWKRSNFRQKRRCQAHIDRMEPGIRVGEILAKAPGQRIARKDASLGVKRLCALSPRQSPPFCARAPDTSR